MSDDAPDRALWPLVFNSDSITAAAVTVASGRGVEMDVVRCKVAAQGEAVEIDSAAGIGTRITVRLAAWLASDGFLAP